MSLSVSGWPVALYDVLRCFGAVVLCGATMLYVPNASRTNYHVIGTDEPFMACNYFYAGMVLF